MLQEEETVVRQENSGLLLFVFEVNDLIYHEHITNNIMNTRNNYIVDDELYQIFSPLAPFYVVYAFLNFIGQNLKVDKLFIDMGFDPNHFTWDAVFHRAAELAWANVNLANMLALVGAVFYVATLMMRTIVPLRVIGIISIAFFIAYGVVAGAVSTFLLYLLSLPINVIRLRQMLSLVKKARMSAQGEHR